MSASGVVSNVGEASWGDNLRDAWRVWVTLDNPRALPETGPMPEFDHDWSIYLPRTDQTPPVIVGNRVIISSHGGRDVTIINAAGVETHLKAFDAPCA